MIILGLHGPARAGKDSVADYLAERYGFVKLSFAHALREEVRVAYGLEDQSLFMDSDTKDAGTERFALKNCADEKFNKVAIAQLDFESAAGGYDKFLYPWGVSLTPRQVLQWWGTEYRRAQDPEYWLKRLEEQVVQFAGFGYPEQRRQHFVVSDVRFENEREWVKGRDPYSTPPELGMTPRPWSGNLWHLHRDGIVAPGAGHSSALPLPVFPGERELYNNASLENLYKGVDLLVSTSAPVVRCEPMEEEERPGVKE